jgi:hypothetical protein
MTEAPDTIAAVDTDRIATFVASWRAELAGTTSVPASEVQDRLLDLWGHLDDGEHRARVESWLTETLSRHLYTTADLETRLASL